MKYKVGNVMKVNDPEYEEIDGKLCLVLKQYAGNECGVWLMEYPDQMWYLRWDSLLPVPDRLERAFLVKAVGMLLEKSGYNID